MKELNLPEGYVPCCAVILGHTDETYEPREIPIDRIRTDYAFSFSSHQSRGQR